MGWMSVSLLNHTLPQHTNGDFSMQHFIGSLGFIGEDTEVSWRSRPFTNSECLDQLLQGCSMSRSQDSICPTISTVGDVVL